MDGRDAELVLEHGGGDGEIAAVEVIEEGGEAEKNDDNPERDGRRLERDSVGVGMESWGRLYMEAGGIANGFEG